MKDLQGNLFLPLLIAAAFSLSAQTPNISGNLTLGTEPEVRRALPVEGNPAPYNSSVAQPSAPRVMKALPVGTPIPTFLAPTPLPANAPIHYPDRIPDPMGSLRIAPSHSQSPAELAAAQLTIADECFGRKQPEASVTEYEKFLAMASRDTPGRERAIYRLGELQRQMGNMVAAESSFQHLLSDYPTGEFRPSASFRIGEMNESRGDFIHAADDFNVTSKNAKDPSIRLAASYREALCRERISDTGEKKQAQTLLISLAQASEYSTYKAQALLHLASSAAVSRSENDKKQALVWYQQLLSCPKVSASNTAGISKETFSEATVKSALLEAELGNPKEAKKLFETIAFSQDPGEWQSIAAFGSLRISAQSGDDEGVIRAAEKALSGDPSSTPEILLLRGNALRKTEKNAKALADYERVISEFPASKAASAAAFQRLLALYASGSPSLPAEIDQYLLTASDPGDRARAQLLKAEETLRKGNFKEAAGLYHAIDTDSIPTTSKPDILYKEAWALTQAGDKDAADAALSRFLTAYPDDDRSSAALAQRGILKQQRNDFSGALADFSQLQEHYPKAAERELALQQKGLLLGQQQDNKGMVETLTLLLRDYPKSTAAAQAHYWIGWVAMENKDYPTAVSELSLARSGDPKQFAERAGLRILLALYYENKPEEAAREAAALKPSLIPPEVSRWLGLREMETGDARRAEHFLSPLVKDGLPGASDAEIQGTLASALVAQGKYHAALLPAEACLKLAREPASRAKALLVAAKIQQSMNNLPQAASMAEEAMLLQPEGSINAEARILSGDILMERKEYNSAAKAFMTAALLHDDPTLTPKALAKAAIAYQKAANPFEAQKALEELRKRFPNVPLPTIPTS
jgi:TolA-binding protein